MHAVGEAWMMLPHDQAWSIVIYVEIVHAQLPQPGGVPPHAPHAGAASAALVLIASPALAVGFVVVVVVVFLCFRSCVKRNSSVCTLERHIQEDAPF